MTDPASPMPSRLTSGSSVSTPAFAHASEAEMSRILDYYGVRWAYEPDVFPILWNMRGDVLESFSPDFYLPDLELYLELTTLRQKLARKKNRKLRRLRELYPDVRAKLFYARDFRQLMLKYGKVSLADALSGTPGQVTPNRSANDMLAGILPPAESSPAPRLDQPAPLATPPHRQRVRRRAARTTIQRSTAEA